MVFEAWRNIGAAPWRQTITVKGIRDLQRAWLACDR